MIGDRIMALPRVDAVCIGVGWTGGILATELAKSGVRSWPSSGARRAPPPTS